MIAQQKHESNNYNSRVFIEQNNPFGMKEAKVRSTTDVDGNVIVGADGKEYTTDSVGYSEYPTLLDAAKDFKLYLDSVNFKPTDDSEKFVLQLKSKGYFTDSVDNYLKGVNFWINK